MIVFELKKILNEIDEDAPVVFVGDDGGWGNVDAEFIDGWLCIKFSEPDKEGRV